MICRAAGSSHGVCPEVEKADGSREAKDVRELVAILASKVQNCRGKLNSQSVGNALYGLQGLTDSEEARQMVAALAPKVCMAFFLRRGPEGD